MGKKKHMMKKHFKLLHLKKSKKTSLKIIPSNKFFLPKTITSRQLFFESTKAAKVNNKLKTTTNGIAM